MSQDTPDKDKKKLVEAKAKTAAKPATPEVAKEKTDLANIMRPDPADKKAGGLKVGAASDGAEKEADKLADAVVADAPVAEEKEEIAEKTEEEPAISNQNIRAPPSANINTFPKITAPSPAVRRTAMESQPNTDTLSTVPALPSNMSEVDVSANEEAELTQVSDNDWSVIAAGEGLQPKRIGTASTGVFYTSAIVATLIEHPETTGAPLAASMRARMENRLGYDLSDVRVHTGSQATALCNTINAKAFAHNNNIWLRSAALHSDTRLMAHETVHTIQQGSAKPLHHKTNLARAPPMGKAAANTNAAPASDTKSPAAIATPHVQRLADDEDPGLLARGAERLADNLDSYGVLKVLIGRRLFTGETINPSAVDFVGAFMKFIGADETFEQMKQSGSLERGFDQIREGLTTYDITWDRVSRTFDRAEDEFDWWEPIDSFVRIFGPFFSDVVSYGAMVLKIIAELVAEAFVIGFGPMGAAVWEKIKSIGDTIGLIVADPLGFAMNLIRAVSQGISGFGERIWEHIKAGLLAWVLGPFAAMGIELPEKLDLRGIISVILQVLGLTYPQLRPRIVRAMNPNGEIKVSVVEKIIEVVNILRTEGFAGIWRKVLEYVENLQMTVINGIRDWVIRAVVQAGIRKLVAWTNPAGALIDILLTIFNLIVFFVEKFNEILEFASSVFDSLGKIARGQLNDAAAAVEKTLAKTIPIIISFMVRLLGLPDIGGAVRKIITNLQAKVHKAFDKALDWILKKVKKLIAKLVDKFRRTTPSEKIDFQLDGEAHKMWAEDKTGKVEIMMASDERAVDENTEEKNKEALTQSNDTLDAPAIAANDQAEQQGDEVHQLEDSLNRRSQADRSTPDNREKAQTEIKEFTEKLQEASTKGVEAVPADTDAADGVEPPVGEGATDRTDLPFRRVIQGTEGIEGTAGHWSDVTGAYQTAQGKAESKPDVYANLHRDHIPAFSLLSKLARTVAPTLLRSGDASIAEDPLMFEKLATNLTNHENKGANGNLPVVVIRAAINITASDTSPLNDSNPLNNGWASDFEEVDGKFIAKASKTAKNQAELNQANTQIAEKYSADNIVANMETHFNTVLDGYRGLPAGVVDDKFVDQQLIGRARPAMDAIVRNIFDNTAETLPRVNLEPGNTGNIKIPYEDELVNGELQTDQYANLRSNFPAGSYMQRHHLLEENIVRDFKEEAAPKSVADKVGTPSQELADAIFAKGEQKLSAEQKDGITQSPEKIEKLNAAKAAMVSQFTETKVSSTFKATQSHHERGWAINVLNSVNQQAGTQPNGPLTSGLAAINTEFGAKYRQTLQKSLQTQVNKSYQDLANDTPIEGSALIAGYQGSFDGRKTTLDALLDEKEQALFSSLTEIAHDLWKPLQETVNTDLSPEDAPNNANGEAIMGRFNALDKASVVNNNITNWFGG